MNNHEKRKDFLRSRNKKRKLIASDFGCGGRI